VRVEFKLWLERDGRVLFGQGRQELLAAVVETGSLAGAAQKMGMSYRAAWGRIKASEERLGFALVEHSGQGRRSTRPTPEARQLLQWYNELEARAQDFVRQALEGAPACLRDSGPSKPDSASDA
jgi:molybdate transport system regulatory protein